MCGPLILSGRPSLDDLGGIRGGLGFVSTKGSQLRPVAEVLAGLSPKWVVLDIGGMPLKLDGSQEKCEAFAPHSEGPSVQEILSRRVPPREWLGYPARTHSKRNLLSRHPRFQDRHCDGLTTTRGIQRR